MSQRISDGYGTGPVKTRITVVYRGKEETISWFDSTSPTEIERLLRQVFDIPPTNTLLMRDLDGDAVVISSRLPDSARFYLFSLTDKYSPTKSPSSGSFGGSFGSVGPIPTSATPANTPMRPTAAAPSFFSTSTFADRLGTSFTAASTPTRRLGSPGSQLNGSAFPFSPASAGEPSFSSPRRDPLSFSTLEESPTRVLNTSQPPREMTTSMAASSLATSSIKEALKAVDRLKSFERRVRELRAEKFEEYFSLDETSRYAWKRIVSHSEFMSAISSDLYYCAGSSGLLSSRKKRDVESILNAALAAYMEAVRDLGRQGNFDPITSADAGFARRALQGAYEAVISLVQDLIREKLTDTETF